MFPVYFLVCFYILLQSSYAQPAGEKGFSLELIHIDSKRSPFYNTNLTNSQRITRSIDRSKSYVLWLESILMIRKANITVMRPPIQAKPTATFMVGVSIGSGNGLRNYYLHLDIASSLTWTQCLPCHKRFPQSAPMFDPQLSPTYRVINCDDPLCKPPYYKCVDHRCEYSVKYYDNSSMEGILSRETFTFQDAHASHPIAIPNIAFGCTHSSKMNYRGSPAGIFSMSRDPTSTMQQLATFTNGLFSYCFFPAEIAHTGFLRFGHDIKMPREGFQSTRILEYPNDEGYYLDVEDISLNKRHLQFPRGTFTRRSDGTGGFLIDSGASVTYLTTYAFDLVEDVMKDYFRLRLNLRPINDSSLPYKLCYKMMHGIEHELPTMTLHFRNGASYHIGQSGLFENSSSKHRLCFAIRSSGSNNNILGAKQQFNIWMRFDTIHNILAFAPHDCLRNAT